MLKPSVTIVLPGLEWNNDWLQQKNILQYFECDWIDHFFSKGRKNYYPLQLSELLSRYLLDDSLFNKIQKESGINIRYGMIISPVYQNMRLHQMTILCGDDLLNISYTEANLLCEKLTQLYCREKYQFHVITPTLWFLETPEALCFDSPCPYDLTDLIDFQIQPQGENSDTIKLLQSEIQMFLFNDEIAQNRKKHAKFPINGVWFWNDLKNTVNKSEFDLILNSKNFAWLRKDCVVEYDLIVEKLKYSINENRSTVVFCDRLFAFNRLKDFQNYYQQFNQLGQKIIKPILKMQEERLISEIRLVSCGSKGGDILAKRSRIFPVLRRLSYQGKWIQS